jgi:alkanesulfonate monooxygenase SsuD/methylene tetrahydromethanopterin reductase-like flavin-dependent oxidoreductase (luciferase family)
MRISIAFTGMTPIAGTIPAVEAADRHGFDGVWTAEHVGFHDAIVPATVYLSRTERLEVGLVGFSSASRHPGLLAMELLSLSELFPGRVRVGVGTGDPSLVAKLGAGIEHPARSSAALVHSLREALAGREMNVAHPGYEFRGFRVAPLGPAPPVDLMAIRPRMWGRRLGDLRASLPCRLRGHGRHRPGRARHRDLAACRRNLAHGALPLLKPRSGPDGRPLATR